MSARIVYEVGQLLYRACCIEQARLEPGRVVKARVVRVGNDGGVKIQEFVFGEWCKPNRATWPENLHAAGWRATEQEAIETGIVYLERITPERIQSAQDCVAALAALKAKVSPPVDGKPPADARARRMDRNAWVSELMVTIARVLHVTTPESLEQAKTRLKELLPLSGYRLLDDLKSPPLVRDRCARLVAFTIKGLGTEWLCAECDDPQVELRAKLKAEAEAVQR